MNIINSLLKLTHLGARLIDSPANQTSTDFFCDALRSFRLKTEEQLYPCIEWENEKLEAIVNPFSLPGNATGQRGDAARTGIILRARKDSPVA